MPIKKSFIVLKGEKPSPFSFQDRQSWDHFFHNLPAGEFVLTVASWYNDRTIKQNAYLHVIFSIIAKHTGNDPADVKKECKRMFAVVTRINIFTGEAQTEIQPTSEMDTQEMTVFIEKIRVWSLEFLSLEIPEANQKLALDNLLNE